MTARTTNSEIERPDLRTGQSNLNPIRESYEQTPLPLVFRNAKTNRTIEAFKTKDAPQASIKFRQDFVKLFNG